MRQDSCGCPVDPLSLLCPSQPLLTETLGDACVHWCAGPHGWCGRLHPFKAFFASELLCLLAQLLPGLLVSSRIIADIFIGVASRLDRRCDIILQLTVFLKIYFI